MRAIVLLIVIILTALPGVSSAGQQTGLITQINVRDDGLHWFHLSGDRGAMPDCTRGHHRYWMIKDENSVYGKSQFSMLLAAYMSRQPVTIYGTGNCTRWGDGEDIKSVQLN